MDVRLEAAGGGDVSEIVALRAAVASALLTEFGPGPWLGRSTERGVSLEMRTSRVLVGRAGRRIVATLRLARKKPWAIDLRHFTPGQKPLYLLAMAVAPDLQRSGIGRNCITAAIEIGRASSADAIRLDAYDSPAGAGAFYAKCGFREVGRATYRGCPLRYFELLF
jgi:ribosomal protein S18 acetylase RimI-like enzyme